MSTHCQYVKEILKYLCKAGLYAKVKKCEFYSKLVEYLEYILSSSELTIFNDKGKGYSELVRTEESQGYLVLSRFCKVLLPIYLQLLEHYHSANLFHLEEYSMKVQLLLL